MEKEFNDYLCNALPNIHVCGRNRYRKHSFRRYTFHRSNHRYFRRQPNFWLPVWEYEKIPSFYYLRLHNPISYVLFAFVPSVAGAAMALDEIANGLIMSYYQSHLATLVP